ncbi:MAG: hypothetical protein ABC585_06920 [Candidatus Methanosuratincola petrocarbonis]|nr:hypothetical protein [Candidatus Methanosuratincola sp.]
MVEKREARIAYIDAVPGMGMVLIIIFRGGWIDTIASCKADAAESLIEWFRTSGYLEEIKAFARGKGLLALRGISELEDWLAERGIRRGELPARNLRQASVIMEGLKEYQRSKSGI